MASKKTGELGEEIMVPAIYKAKALREAAGAAKEAGVNIRSLGGWETADSGQSSDSQWDQALAQAVRRYQSRQPFAYDHTQDPLYHQYAQTYTREGKRAAEDTVGKVSARTGGLASSYAVTAAAQAENYYLQQLADKIPQLREAAYKLYQNETERLRKDVELYQKLAGK